jgi:glutathione S-transferase
MKLYDGGRVPNARRVRIYLAEKGLEVEKVPVDLGRNEHKTSEFARLNPLRCVPVLQLDDGTILTESIAICRYFEELHPSPPMFGEGARGRALVEMWQRRLEFELYISAAFVFRHTHPAMAGSQVPQIPAWGEANRAYVENFLGILDGHLKSHEFVAGDRMSVADITGFIAIEFFKAAKIPPPERHAHVMRWHAALAARPSARA